MNKIELRVTYSHRLGHLALADHRAEELLAGRGEPDEASAQRVRHVENTARHFY